MSPSAHLAKLSAKRSWRGGAGAELALLAAPARAGCRRRARRRRRRSRARSRRRGRARAAPCARTPRGPKRCDDEVEVDGHAVSGLPASSVSPMAPGTPGGADADVTSPSTRAISRRASGRAPATAARKALVAGRGARRRSESPARRCDGESRRAPSRLALAASRRYRAPPGVRTAARACGRRRRAPQAGSAASATRPTMASATRGQRLMALRSVARRRPLEPPHVRLAGSARDMLRGRGLLRAPSARPVAAPARPVQGGHRAAPDRLGVDAQRGRRGQPRALQLLQRGLRRAADARLLQRGA